MNTNYQSRVGVNDFFSINFLAQVGLHQGWILIPVLFIVKVESLSAEII